MFRFRDRVGTRLIASRLYGAAPHGPMILTIATIVPLVIALLATGIPAVRASRVDPMAAWR